MPKSLDKVSNPVLEDSQPIPFLLVSTSKHTTYNQCSTAGSGDLNQTCGLAVGLD